MKCALEALEARSEVGDLNDVAVSVLEDRLHDRGIAHIARTALACIMEHDVAKSLLLFVGEKAREDRIGVKAREAPPDDAPAGVDERSNAAVADRGEIEIAGWR